MRRKLCTTRLDAPAFKAVHAERMLTKYHYPNITGMNVYLGDWECDVLTITKAGYSHEYEVKVSAADFRADAMKTRDRWDTTTRQRVSENKHQLIASGRRTNRFSFVVPEKLVGKVEVPDWAGLVVAVERIAKGARQDIHWLELEVERDAPMIHRSKENGEAYRLAVLESLWHRTNAGLELPGWHVASPDECEGSGI